jgi:mannitol-1-phosphate 5-dehydrogenase
LNKILIFGAGKIGRSFIGQLFGKAGYETVFVDIDKNIIDLLNARRSYRIIIKGATEEYYHIEHVRAIHFLDRPKVIEEILTSDLIALSVGQQGMLAVIALLAEGIKKRQETIPGRPVDIIIAENIINGDKYLKEHLLPFLGENFPVDSYIGLIETSIGKMVPLMTAEDMAEDPLQIFAEPYNTLILAGRSFKNPVPDIPGLAPKDNMKAWVDRKLFIHNLGHAACAYFGYLKHPDRHFMYEVLADSEIHRQTYQVMHESAQILLRKYPAEFTAAQMEDHINDLLERFQNRALKDTVFRVGCDLKRKLGPEDRLVYPLREAHKAGLPAEKILYALICGFYFRAKDETGSYHPNDTELFAGYPENISGLLSIISGFDTIQDRLMISRAQMFCRQINTTFATEIKLN